MTVSLGAPLRADNSLSAPLRADDALFEQRADVAVAPTESRGPVLPPSPAPKSPPHTNRRLGIAAIVLSATAMGAAGLFGRKATPEGAVLGEALTLGRMAVGALGMLILIALSRRLGQLRRTRLSWSVVGGGVLLGLSLATYLSATVLTDLSRAVVLHYLGPVVATALARVFLKERVGRLDALSIGTAFAGMLLAAGLVGGESSGGEHETLGTVLGAASGVFYGGALLCYRYRTDMPSDVRSLWNFVFGAVAAGGMVAVTRPDMSGMTATHWLWAGGFFVVCGLFALGLLVVAGKHLRSAELSGLSYLEVVVALMIGMVAFGESVTVLAAAGAGLIVVAMALPVFGRR
ncbi:DMT family transporter [Rhodococcus rhodochrous]|uniref:EamA domain-containing membrane protein RarD n=1 Tax=Rhodococcus rhodochrous J45 TaxID=935266 RepID=A0A562E5G4_RHORH|nr:DMT family transporter [Rhodococcus rhodochrous]TWH17060.1 EamA domain-containing membrane protein RarD [Rhodococcus rhodochrous J45]